MSTMINLLPVEEKRTLTKEYRLRTAVAILAVVFILEGVAAAAFAPAMLMVLRTEKALTATLEQKRASIPASVEVERKELAAIAAEVALLDPSKDAPDMDLTEIIGKILSRKGERISLSGFQYDAVPGATSTIQVRGFALDRDSLLAFQRDLKLETLFAAVEVPSGFIKKTDLDFTVKIFILPSKL